MNKNQLKSDKALENFRVFPIIAWATMIFFVLFVYTITMDLKAATMDLQTQTQQLQKLVTATTTPAHTNYER